MSEIALIWAMSENGVIGRDNGLPWRLHKDMQHFMRTTLGKPVIMGRRTFESMKAPLSGRLNVVMTRDPHYRREGIEVVPDLETALQVADATGAEELMVIGGAAIYAEALPRADRLYVTRVHAEVEGDTLFPDVDWSVWQRVQSQSHEADARNEHPFTIEVYERRQE